MTASPPSPVERGAARSIDDLLVNVSASRLSTWQQCRLKFYFRYILAIRRPKPPALHVGSSIHETLKYWNKARWRNQQPSLKELHDIYSTSWETNLEKEPVNWFGEEAEQKQAGWKLLETYFRESPINPDEKPEGVEVSVQASLSKHGLPDVIGIIDLVRPNGRIVDFKSTGKTPDALQVAHTTSTQIACYSLLYREATGRTETAIELHHLVKTKSPKLVVTVLDPVSEVQKSRLLHVIESYARGLQKHDWIPSPGMQCASCEFFSECASWS
jgi:CRISPR/Cas system-associated exonuclease Cas4 (RecB family)